MFQKNGYNYNKRIHLILTCIFLYTMSTYVDPVDVELINVVDEISSHKIRVTKPYLTKYEKARILGLRATQISKQAKPTVDIGDIKDALKIAEKEFKYGNIPFIVRRHLPDGSFEDWKLSELQKSIVK